MPTSHHAARLTGRRPLLPLLAITMVGCLGEPTPLDCAAGPDPAACPDGDPRAPGAPPMQSDAPYAAQWSSAGPHDIDLLSGELDAVDFRPADAEPVVIGLVDTGVDPRHPELAHAIWRNPHEIAGDCVDNDGNGYVDDVHGIRVDVHRFDGALLDGPARQQAFAAACVEHGGDPIGPGECSTPAEASVADARAIAGLHVAWRRAASALDGNPLLHARRCPDDFGAGRAERIALAEGDPTDFWYGHGTLMAGTMAALSPEDGEVASLLQAPSAGAALRDHVRIVTCAAGFVGDIRADGRPSPFPMGTADGFARCLDYFADLIDRGVNLRVINLSLGYAERFPLLGQPDIPMTDEVLLHRSPAVQAGLEALTARDVSIVAAAHNMYRDVDGAPAHAMFPAAFELPGLIGVGGISRRGTWFGNRGRRTVDVVAPATDVVSPAVGPDLALMARLIDPARRVRPGTPPFDRLPRGEGTSQATAYVSTVVALMRAHEATAGLDAPAIRRRLIASSSPLPPLPWMAVLRESADLAMQGFLQALLGLEPTTGRAKQAELEANSIAGGIVRLDAALDCRDRPFGRLTGPVQRQAVAVGEALVIEAEAFDCEAPAGDAALGARVVTPDGREVPVALEAMGGGVFRASFVVEAPGSHAIALDARPDDALELVIE